MPKGRWKETRETVKQTKMDETRNGVIDKEGDAKLPVNLSQRLRLERRVN